MGVRNREKISRYRKLVPKMVSLRRCVGTYPRRADPAEKLADESGTFSMLSSVLVNYHLAKLAVNTVCLQGIRTAQDVTAVQLKHIYQAGKLSILRLTGHVADLDSGSGARSMSSVFHRVSATGYTICPGVGSFIIASSGRSCNF